MLGLAILCLILVSVVVKNMLATVEACDCLVWLDKGKIRMMGSVDKVMPEYRRALEDIE